MKKIVVETSCKRMLADVFTPVGIYLRLRDRFRDTVLLESTDHHVAENSYSFIGINAIAGIEVSSTSSMEFKFPNQKPERAPLKKPADAPNELWNFMQQFEILPATQKEAAFAAKMKSQGFEKGDNNSNLRLSENAYYSKNIW